MENENNIKQIIINTQSHIKKIDYKKKQTPRVETVTWELTDPQLESIFQYELIKKFEHIENNVQLTNQLDLPIYKLIKNHIKNKISSYKQQDINKKRFNNLEFINYNDVVSLIIDCKLNCHYCACEVYLLYTFVREGKQWSLDRINNDKGHNKGNLVIACLECNLKRRRTNKEAFMFTKNFKIIRKDL